MNQEMNQEDTYKIGLVGFVNIGNTCYMNSILQLLKSSRAFVNHFIRRNGTSEFETFLERASIERIIEKEKKNGTEVVLKKSDVEQFRQTSLLKEFGEIINTVYLKGSSVITPDFFKRVLDHKMENFRGRRHQDAHEFLTKVIELFIEENGVESDAVINNVPPEVLHHCTVLKQAKSQIKNAQTLEEKRQIINDITEYKRANRHLVEKYESLNYIIKTIKPRYNSLIYDLLTCVKVEKICGNPKCRQISTVYESTYAISIPVKDSIQEGFHDYTKQENIDQYKCSFCEENSRAVSQVKIYKCPRVLFVHLKRFVQEFRHGKIITDKDDTDVTIPMELDLNPYMDHSLNTDRRLSNRYALKGICNHSGNLHMGHYTADCAGVIDPQNWYHFNDSSVYRYNGTNIDTSSAYIAMYEMIDV